MYSLVSILICLSAIVATQQHIDLFKLAFKVQPKIKYIPDSGLLKVASFGFPLFLADLLWLRSIQNFDENIISTNSVSWMYKHLDVVTDLDPRYRIVYTSGGLFLSVLKQDKMGATLLYEKGTKLLSEDWRIPYYLGYHYLYELNDKENAARVFHMASLIKGSPDYLPLLVTRIYSSLGRFEVATGFLSSILATTIDERMRDSINKRLLEIQTDKDIEVLQNATNRYREIENRAPASLEALVDKKIIHSLPKEPFGGYYYIENNIVKSSKKKSRLNVFTPN